MNEKLNKKNEIILSKRDKKYQFAFELIEEEKNLLLKVDQKVKNEDITIDSLRVILNQIKSNYKNNRLEFNLEDKKYIKLYYYFLNGEKEQIIIPFAYNP